MKTTKFTRFLSNTKTRANLVSNSNRERKKQKHNTCKTRIQQDFIARMK
jgi:hypothetical protein